MKFNCCNRCGEKLGIGFDGEYYDVRPSSEWSRFGHKGEAYICEKCLKADPRYKAENEESFFKKIAG